VEVLAFDYEISARARADAGVCEPGIVLVPGRLLVEITTRLPRQPAELADDGPALALACGGTLYRLYLLPLDTYPALPELTAAAGHADPGEFAAAVCSGGDRRLPRRHPAALGAVQFTFTADAVTLVATDRYRAALRRLPWQATGVQLPCRCSSPPRP
jgi:DNA polymerase III subunit beta